MKEAVGDYCLQTTIKKSLNTRFLDAQPYLNRFKGKNFGGRINCGCSKCPGVLQFSSGKLQKIDDQTYRADIYASNEIQPDTELSMQYFDDNDAIEEKDMPPWRRFFKRYHKCGISSSIG